MPEAVIESKSPKYLGRSSEALFLSIRQLLFRQIP